eukprot:s30_g47.t1
MDSQVPHAGGGFRRRRLRGIPHEVQFRRRGKRGIRECGVTALQCCDAWMRTSQCGVLGTLILTHLKRSILRKLFRVALFFYEAPHSPSCFLSNREHEVLRTCPKTD